MGVWEHQTARHRVRGEAREKVGALISGGGVVRVRRGGVSFSTGRRAGLSALVLVVFGLTLSLGSADAASPLKLCLKLEPLLRTCPAPAPDPTPAPAPDPTPTPAPAPAPPIAIPLPTLTASPAPTPTATPARSPSPRRATVEPPPTAATVSNASAAPPPAGTAFDVPATRSPPALATVLSPFPVVRIVGRLTRTGARIYRFSVRAPRGVRVRVACRGADCPTPLGARGARASTWSAGTLVRSSRPVSFRRLRRPLRAGVLLRVWVTSPDKIGKYTRVKIRKGKFPARRDLCLPPTTGRPIGCPTS